MYLVEVQCILSFKGTVSSFESKHMLLLRGRNNSQRAIYPDADGDGTVSELFFVCSTSAFAGSVLDINAYLGHAGASRTRYVLSVMTSNGNI